MMINKNRLPVQHLSKVACHHCVIVSVRSCFCARYEPIFSYISANNFINKVEEKHGILGKAQFCVGLKFRARPAKNNFQLQSLNYQEKCS